MNWIAFAARNTLRHKRRSLLTLSLGALAVMAILLAGGFALFTFEGLKQQAARGSGHLILAARDYFKNDEDALLNGLAGHDKLAAELLRDERVKATLPCLPFSGLVSNGDKSVVFVGEGVDAGREFQVKGPFLNLVAGSLLSHQPDLGAPAEALIGRELGRTLKVSPGQRITLLTTTRDGSLNAQDVSVRGIVSTGVPDIDRRLVYVALPTAQQLLATDRIGRLAVHFVDDSDETAAAMSAGIAALHPELDMRSWRDEAFYYESVKALYQRIFGILIAIMLTLALFAVANTLSMSVSERTREIGAFRALGYTPAEIRRLFAWEGGFLGGAAAIAGIFAAAVATLAITFAEIQMPPPPGRSDTYPLGISFDAGLYLGTAVAITALSALIAWVAARRASRQAIPEALEHV